MNFTPHWQQIRQSYPEAHASLQWAAGGIYQQSKETVPIPPVDEVDLSPGLELGFLRSDNGKVGFSDPAVRHDYLVRYAVNLVIAAWDELENFASLFYEIYRCSIRINVGSQIGVAVLLVLNSEYKKDLVGRVAEVARLETSREKRDKSREKIYEFFCDALPELDLKLESLVDVFELIFQTNAGYKIYSIVENLAAHSQSNADFIYNKFVVAQEPRIVSLAFYALRGLAKFNPDEAHRRALVLTNSEQSILRQIGIAFLGEFSYETSKQSDLLQATLDKFNSFKEKFNVETDLVLLQAYGNLANKSDEAAAILVEFASSQNHVVREQLSNILFQKASEAYSCSWYKEVLLHLVQIPSFSTEMLDSLDYCINYCLKNDPKTALQLVEFIALGWDYSSGEQASLPKIIDSTFIELHNNHLNALNSTITRWFASHNKQLHLAGSDVIRFFNSIPVHESDDDTTKLVHKKKAKNRRSITLHKEVLDTLDEQTVVWVLYRLAGYITDIASLPALLLSALKREIYSPNIASLIVVFLREYVLYNHPRDAGDYLKSRMKDDDVTEAEINVIQEALNDSDAYLDARQKLPYLKELKPSSQRTYLLQLAKWKQEVLMMEKAEQSSVFASILPTVKLKYGRAIASERDGDFTEPSQMATFSYEAEFPQGEFINPLGQFRMRLQWQNVGLNNTKNSIEDEITGETTV